MEEIKWDIRRGAEIYRVIYNSRLKGWISTGKIKRGETMVWRSGFSGWRKPEELPELAPFFESWEKLKLSGEEKRIERKRLQERVIPQQKRIRNILIIDDEKDLCLLLADALSGEGYHVATANTRREGMVCIKKESPDLVFLDLKLPDCDGIKVLSAIRRRSPETIVNIISAYGSEDNLEKAAGMGVKVIAPAMGSYQKGLPLSAFNFSSSGKVLSCPQGQVPQKNRRNKDRHRAAFDSKSCLSCPLIDQCPVHQGKKYHYLRYEHKTFHLAQRRQQEQTADFKNTYRYRSGVEGTISIVDRKTGIKHLRVRGFKAIRFCVNLKAAGMNILRAAAFKIKEKARCLGQKAGQSGAYNPFLVFKELFMKNLGSPAVFWADDYHQICSCAA